MLNIRNLVRLSLASLPSDPREASRIGLDFVVRSEDKLIGIDARSSLTSAYLRGLAAAVRDRGSSLTQLFVVLPEPPGPADLELFQSAFVGFQSKRFDACLVGRSLFID